MTVFLEYRILFCLDCRDNKIWMVIRHGTRLPGIKDILNAQNLTKIKQEILLQHSNGKGLFVDG